MTAAPALLFVIVQHPDSYTMASASVLRRLEVRAASAEQMILYLKKEIADIKQFCSTKSGSSDNVQARQLEEENRKLAKEVDECKQKLIRLELANGKQQIALPTSGAASSSAIPNKVSSTSLPAAQNKSSESATIALVKEAGAKSKKKPQAPKQPEKADDDVTRLDLRVGLIINAERHPDADSLYVETVEIGAEKPLTVVSGLAGKVPLEEMQNRLVVLLCNLKPAKMRGIVSQAMVMCASDPGGKVEVLIPPAGSAAGDRVALEGSAEPLSQPDTQLKSKVWEAVAAKLKTRSDLVAGFDGKALTVPGKGQIKAATLVGVPIK